MYETVERCVYFNVRLMYVSLENGGLAYID